MTAGQEEKVLKGHVSCLILALLLTSMLTARVLRVRPVGASMGAMQSKTGIIIGTTDSVVTCLDPALAYDFFGWQIIQSLGCGLVEDKFNASSTQARFVPSLATSWNVSDEGLAWTFNLRQGVKYDDGTELNATHVKYTFDRGIGIASPEGAWTGIGYVDIIKNVIVIDKYTVRFDLHIPFVPFLSLLSRPVAFIVDPAYAPMNQVVTYNEGNPRASNPMGLGPYVLKNWTRVAGRDIEMELEANPNYWNANEGLPRTKNIIIKIYSSHSSLALAITYKQIDIAFRQLTASDIITMKNDATLKVWEASGAFIQYLVLQEKYAPFNVTAIRKAVGAAVNRTALVQTAFLGQARNLYSTIPTGMFEHTDAFLDLGDPNYTRTRELLAPLGYNESNKLAFTLSYEISGHYPQSQQQAQVLKASIEASGIITVNLQGLEWPALKNARSTGTMEAFIYGWYPDYIDPDDYVYWLVHSVGASWLNYSYSNATVDELIQTGREKLTTTERATVYSQIQYFVAEDCPIIPLYQSQIYAVSVQGIEGIYLDLTELLRLWYIERVPNRTWIVDDDGPADFHIIQEAINAAGDGDTVSIRAGVYYEEVLVNKSISLVGEDRETTIIHGNISSYALTIGVENVSIASVAVTNASTGILIGANNPFIHDVKVSGNYMGVWASESLNGTIRDSVIVNQTVYHGEYENLGGAGIGLDQCGFYNILNNSISNNEAIGIWVRGGFILAEENRLNDNGAGVELDWATNCTVIKNFFLDNLYGVEVSEASNCSVYANNFTGNTYWAIELSGSTGILIYHNNFVNDTVRAYSTNSNSFWDNGCEGNFWSNYNGTDTDNDGVGDTYLPWEGVDNYPLLNVYWNPCDVSHDLKVDMRDIGVSAKAFGTVPGDTLWNPHADITGPEPIVPDWKVDMRDIGLVARHFGEHYS